jgi:glucose-1-phosphate cytidylyltransferase
MYNDLPVVILCGGKGTRLVGLTDIVPKPLVEVGGKPILWHIMKIYSSFGFNNFILCLGHKGNKIKEYFLNYEIMTSDIKMKIGSKEEVTTLKNNVMTEKDWKISLVHTGEEAMTGARIKKIQNYIHTEHFFLTYGDGVSDVDIKKLLAFHLKHGKIGTITGVRPYSRFGQLEIVDDRVTSFSEKSQTKDGRINGGFFVFSREVFKYLSNEDNCTLEQEPLENMANDRELMIYKHDGFWQCMDTPRDCLTINDFLKSDVPWLVDEGIKYNAILE